MTPDAFRRLGHELIDWIADYRERLEELPVRSNAAPGEVRARMPQEPPEHGAGLDGWIEEVSDVVMPGVSHWQHPSWFAFFPGNASLASVLGDLASAGLGVVGVSWQASPALAEVEEVVVDWARQMVGLSSDWRGAIQDTASTSTLVALLCARERSSGYTLAGGGMAAMDTQLRVYTTEHGHSSVEKAALLAGFGRANLRVVPHDHEYAMRPDALAAMMADDRRAGRVPCAVVATAGTTATTAFDPIGAVAEVAAGHGAWLHVDAAMAGAAMVLPECRALWQGVEGADSIVVNAHKWWGAAFDCSLYFVRDVEHLVRVMSTDPSYLRSRADAEATNFRDWGIPLGRRFRALKLWALLRDQGVEGLRARIRRDLAHARWLAERVASAPGWRVVAPVRLQTVCVRHVPEAVAGEDLDRYTLAWAERLNRSGRAYVTPAILDGRWMVRVSIGAEATERRQVEKLWDDLQWAVEGQPE